MLKFAFVIAAVLVLVAPAQATIFTWFCNSGTCGDGSCNFNGNITEGVCSYGPSRSYTNIKATCAVNPTVSQLCISASTCGPAAAIPAGALDCNSAVMVTQTFPCDICLQSGPDGQPMKFSSCVAGGQFDATANFSFHCNTDCSSCASVSRVTTEGFEQIAGYFSKVKNVFSCPTVIPYQLYQGGPEGPICNNPVGDLQYYVPGLHNCNGYQDSNARANMFTCV
jgi:hypothetical protein